MPKTRSRLIIPLIRNITIKPTSQNGSRRIIFGRGHGADRDHERIKEKDERQGFR